MARIFRQAYTINRNGKRVTRQSRKWYVEYRDGQSIRRRKPGFTDKQATQQLASDLEKQAAREEAGLVDRFAEHRKQPLTEHVKDWRTALLAKGGRKSTPTCRCRVSGECCRPAGSVSCRTCPHRVYKSTWRSNVCRDCPLHRRTITCRRSRRLPAGSYGTGGHRTIRWRTCQS